MYSSIPFCAGLRCKDSTFFGMRYLFKEKNQLLSEIDGPAKASISGTSNDIFQCLHYAGAQIRKINLAKHLA